MKFTHLHVHSEYSLLDSTAKIKELVSKTKELGMDSIALTDHGVMYGVIDFYKEAKKQGIKPIIGCEVYVASKSRFLKEASKDNFYYHLVLLAENNEGYQNLLKLVSYGFTEGYYYKPRIDLELLKKHKKGLIALSACLSGPVAKTIRNVSYEKGLEVAKMYRDLMGEDNFFLEIQDHNITDEKIVYPQILKMARETDIPLVCTNDSHYILKEDNIAHDIFLCVQTGKTIHDEDRMSYGSDQLYLKSPEEMARLFNYAEDALENTVKIAERCNVDIEFNNYKLPIFELPKEQDHFEYLKKICFEGLKYRYSEITEELRERLLYELNMIESMGFVDYFLIVWDFIKYAYDNGIMVGPGRGSAAGSLVAYSLRITNIDPIKYNLIFERFLNPERISMPDIDIDFCYERRQEVIDYVTEKYGSDHVAQIITFGTLAARASIRDTGRALGIPYQTVDSISKMIPTELGITISRALQINPELKSVYETDDEIKHLIDMSLKLEGLPRHASTHAAGVVICDVPVTEYVPLNQNDGVITTQFPMTTLEELGLLKMDFLGLRTLTVIRDTVQEIKRIYGKELDLDKIDYEDEKVYEMISQAKTNGVFQLESSGMKAFMKDLKPKSLEDIIAGISLYRPGPMDFIPKYVSGKNNPEKIEYTHESLKPILNSTYGCIVYQEQVMQIVRDLAGYSMGRSDLVRRAMSKKKTDVMEKERKIFIYGGEGIDGCIKRGIDEKSASLIFDQMIDFAKYAFNKSHAAAYAIVGYQTAWLKYYYPTEFMAALMTSIMDTTLTKIAEYIDECKKMNIKLLPPDINESFERFSVSEGGIRFGLAAIKNVGRPVIRSLVKEREENGKFISLTEFINRLDSKDLNKRSIESFIKSGALDSLGGRRSQYMDKYKQILDGINNTKKKNIEGQLDLFSMTTSDPSTLYKDDFRDIPEFSQKEILSMEKEVLGIYISGHPLSEYEEILKKHINITSSNLLEGNDDQIIDGKKVVIGGIIASKSVKYTKNNRPMAFLTLEDLYGTSEIIVFPNIYEKYLGKLVEDMVIIVKGSVTIREEEDGKIICDRIIPIDEIENEKGTLWLKIPAGSSAQIDDLISILKAYPGRMPVMIYDEKTKKKFAADEKFWVNNDLDLQNSLQNLLGSECVAIKK